MNQIDPNNWLTIPEAPPDRFWMTPEIAPLQAILDAGERPWTTEEMIEYHRLRGKEDLYFFAAEICGFGRSWPDGRLDPALHAPLAWAWQAPNGELQGDGRPFERTRLAMMPRGHLKTTLCTQAYALWRLIRNPDERILIYCANLTLAKKIFSWVKDTLEGKGRHGQLFLACYGDIVPDKGEKTKWTDTMLTLKRKGAYTDASLEASGVGSGVTGGHFTVQCVDDLIDRELPAEQIRKLCNTFDNLTPLFDSLKTGERRIVGTHWAFADPYHYVKESWPNALVAQRTWCEKYGAPSEEYIEENLIFDYCDVEEALKLKARNPYFFSCQYMNNPNAEGKIGFEAAWFRKYIRRGDTLIHLEVDGSESKLGRVSLTECNIFLLNDPNTTRLPGELTDSGKAAGDRDYAAWVMLAVDKLNHWYVLEVVRERHNPAAFVEETFRLVDYWKPKFVAIEQVAAQRLFLYIFHQEFKHRDRKPFVIVPWKGGHASKEERIKGLIPHYSNGMVFHRAFAPDAVARGMRNLEQELLDFPHAKFDDVADALSAGLQLVYGPSSERAKEMGAERVLSGFEVDMLKRDSSERRAHRILEKKNRSDVFGLGRDFWN